MNTVVIKKETEINVYGAFLDFRGMLIEYFCKNSNANLEIGHTAMKIDLMDKIHQTLFMVYILEYWNAYTMDIINGNYNYVNLTSMVWNSWLEHMAR